MSKEALKSMLTNLINDKDAEASLDFSNFVTAKMKDIAGLSAAQVQVENDAEGADTNSEQLENNAE